MAKFAKLNVGLRINCVYDGHQGEGARGKSQGCARKKSLGRATQTPWNRALAPALGWFRKCFVRVQDKIHDNPFIFQQQTPGPRY